MATSFTAINSDALLPTPQEVLRAFTDFGVSDYVALVGTALWLGLLAAPLVGVDRRARIAAATYAITMGALATTLIRVLPEQVNHLSQIQVKHLATFLLATLVALGRWHRHWRDPSGARHRGAAPGGTQESRGKSTPLKETA